MGHFFSFFFFFGGQKADAHNFNREPNWWWQQQIDKHVFYLEPKLDVTFILKDKKKKPF